MNFKNSKSRFVVFALVFGMLVLFSLGKNVFAEITSNMPKGEQPVVAAPQVEAIPIGVRDVRKENFPEKIIELYAKGISAKTDSVVYIFFDNGTYSENQDGLYKGFDAKDIDVIEELRGAARLSVLNGAKFNRIVQTNSETGTDRVIIYIDGIRVYELPNPTPLYGAVTSNISEDTIELWNVVQESNRKWGAKQAKHEDEASRVSDEIN